MPAVPAVTKSHPESRRLRHGAQQAGLCRAEPAGEVGNGQDPDVLRNTRRPGTGGPFAGKTLVRPEARSGPAPPPQPCSPACAGRRGMRGPGRGRRCRQSAWLRQAGSEWERLVQDCQKVASLNSYGPVSTDSVDEQFARRDSLGL